jgi:NAD(P)-dependent dehydrogenase (short-subunit alcohol dehydrogenase family)
VFDLGGRMALVTGAGQGVGVGIASTLARAGASVAINDIAADRATTTADAIVAAGGRAIAVPFDVTDEGAVADGFGTAAAALGGPIDILVNNAGVPATMAMAPFVDLEPRQWRDVVELNLFGSLLCIRAVLPAMRARGWGRVIQISSGAAQAGLSIGVSLYGASKSGVEGFLRHLSQEVAREGITVNAIALGLMANAVPDLDDGGDVLAKISRSVPVGRLGRPDDAGAIVTFVASDEAEWLTGQTIQLNGGQTTT